MAAAAGKRLAGRIALITGASRGIGAAVARRCAAEGAHVVLTARTAGALEEIDDGIRAQGGAGATLVPLDLRQAEKIEELAAALYQRFGRLDALIGCAGVLGALSPLGHIEPKIWQEVMEVNFAANWRLLRVLDPLLRRSDAGRAVFATCAAARECGAFWGAYAASKAALEAMLRVYAAEIEASPLKVNLVDPGPVATRLRAWAFPGEDKSRLVRPEAVTEPFVTLAAADCAVNGIVLRPSTAAPPPPSG